MITDMKSFSRMTEEDGSVATAKAIQRHRDLLLPIIQRHNGCGKSTGGDGLVAAFESAADALLAAAEMQRALATHNAAHPDEREIWVRIGLASGEVVLDKGGRPFIGAGAQPRGARHEPRRRRPGLRDRRTSRRRRTAVGRDDAFVR